MNPPSNLAPFFSKARRDQARRTVALWERLGWWKPRPQTEAEAAQIIDTYETESRER
ncbi:MAG: hypothetical protein M0R06_21820 [Sphaerochaeta sp.]|jgi:hypothetical protein|nr:hypothetical protein [Sphaerochaeta sp.]